MKTAQHRYPAGLTLLMLLVALIQSPVATRALTVERPASTKAHPPIVWKTAALEGGDIRSLAIHPDDPDTILAGTASGQLFVSVDAGDRWRPVTEQIPFAGWVVSDLMFDSERPERVWAALRGVLGEEGFVAVSEDGGVTWASSSEGLPGRQVYALASAPGRMYAATRQGVWGSIDEGRTWNLLTFAHPEIEKVTSLLVDPENPSTVFAGTWRRAYRSDDEGRTWRGVFNGMVLDSEVFSLHAVPGTDGELWASTCGWVYRGTNRGESWRRFSNGLRERRTPSFRVLPDGDRLAGTVAGVYRSADNGGSWQRVTPKSLVALAIETHPERPERVFVGSEGAGVWRSVDGGSTFRSANKGLNAVRIASLAAVGDEILAAVRHAGPASGIYSSFDGGRTYPLGPAKLPTVTELASDGTRAYAATDEGLWERREDAWRRVEELGSVAVRQVVSSAGRVVARTDRGLWIRARDASAFERLAFDRGPIASIAVDDEMVWISSLEGGLFRLEGQEILASATPIAAGRLHSVAGRLLIAGGGELWERAGLEAPWTELGQGLDFHPTGDPDLPLLLVDGNGDVRLHDQRWREGRSLELSVPSRDLSAALIAGNRLLLGTSGYGVLIAELEDERSRTDRVVESSR